MQNTTDRHSFNKNLWRTLGQIQEALHLENTDMEDLLELKGPKYKRLQAKTSDIPLDSIYKLSHGLNLSVNNILRSNVDYQTLQEHYKGNFSYIPKKYQEADFSKRRTSINVLSYMDTCFRSTYSREVLSHFQIHESAFSEPEKTISINFVSDLCAHINQREDISDQHFYEMGIFSYYANRDTSLGQILSRYSSNKEVLEKTIYELITNFDKNYDYTLSNVTKFGAVLIAKPAKWAQEALNSYVIGNEQVCKTKEGVIASLPLYIGNPLCHVEETRCIHKGHKHCQFDITF